MRPFKFVENKAIDRLKWNECIKQADNGLLYAQTRYLDALCPNWAALIHDNYDWVLPLTFRKKWGISYLYQPSFTQQLGLFATDLNTVPYPAIFSYLKLKFSYWQFNWNYAFDPQALPVEIGVKPATNFIIDLSTGYSSIENNYHKDLEKNLNRSKKFDLCYSVVENYTQSIALYRQFYSNRLLKVTPGDYAAFTTVCQFANENNMLVNRVATNSKGSVLATALLLNDGRRLYNLMNATTPEGRKIEANHFLLDSVIREFAGKDLLFDFEGSDLPGVNSFYQNFGAVNQPYFQLHYNRLPWPIKLLKR